MLVFWVRDRQGRQAADKERQQDRQTARTGKKRHIAGSKQSTEQACSRRDRQQGDTAGIAAGPAG